MKFSWKENRRWFLPAAYTLGVLIVLFILLDMVVMPWYVQRGKTTQVPDVVGLKFEEAQKVLLVSGLVPKEFEHKMDKRYSVGTITLQNPPAGTIVKPDRGVYLTISGGEVLTVVPNLRGKSIRDATFSLERFGLRLGNVTYEPSDDIIANTIIRQALAPGAKVHGGAALDIVVSQGRTTDKRLVPDVTLKLYTEAEKKILHEGFKIGKVTYQVSLDLLPNTVVEQYPHAGSMADFGQTIDLIVVQKGETPSPLENQN
ncbi:MAG TPA: PASTA domain-containing protein [Bacteroidota bacterium]|nr:PASTA domain-containing protein [Bacteroidota bacterium]